MSAAKGSSAPKLASTPYSNSETTEPSSARIAVAIAGYPYSPKAAILDIVDNSVAANATGISITLPASTNGDVAIADSGSGIPDEILPEVLRAGSRVQDRYDAKSLSRYGIGLKGAGFSLGGKIVLLTRHAGGPIRRRCIELALIKASDEWIQETREPLDKEVQFFEKTLKALPGENGKHSGTVILIGDLNLRSQEIGKLRTDIARGLGETYQKFLNRGLLNIRINEIEIEAVDPLHRENPQTLTLFKREPVTLSNGSTIYFSAVSLPHPHQLPQDLRRKYRYAQVNQGFYLYRNGRLLRSGETLGLFNYDFHLNAFRAELEYSTDADEHINVDVAKSSVTVTPEVQQSLQDMVTTCRKTCDTLWREKDVLSDEDIKDLFSDTNKLIASRSNLLVEGLGARKKKALASSAAPKSDDLTNSAPLSSPPAKTGIPSELPPASPLPKTSSRDVPYLQPVENLPGDVLYRPIWSGDVNAVVVQVNKQHPFYKAVFSTSTGEGRDSLPRAAATATQQLIYVLGVTEWNVATDDDLERIFEQYRRFAAMNLRALLE